MRGNAPHGVLASCESSAWSSENPPNPRTKTGRNESTLADKSLKTGPGFSAREARSAAMMSFPQPVKACPDTNRLLNCTSTVRRPDTGIDQPTGYNVPLSLREEMQQSWRMNEKAVVARGKYGIRLYSCSFSFDRSYSRGPRTRLGLRRGAKRLEPGLRSKHRSRFS